MWIVLALAAAFCEALRGTLGKVAARGLDSYSLAWGMIALQGLLLLPVLLFTDRPPLAGGFFVALLCGSLVDIAGTVAYMRALRGGDLSLTVPLLSFSPIFLLVLAPLINGEVPTVRGLAGVVLVFVGTYLLRVRDRSAGLLGPFRALFDDKSARYMLAAALLWSLTVSLHKEGIRNSSAWFWPAAYFCWMALLMSPLVWWKVRGGAMPVLRSWRTVLPIGVCAAAMSLAQMLALDRGPVVYVASIKNLSALFALGFGAAVFREGGMRERLAGTSLMVAGAVLIILA